MSEVKFKMAAGTNVGMVRTNNEDNFIVCPDLNTSEWLIPRGDDYVALGDLGAMVVVADGMGGMNAGEVASAIAVETIQQLFVPEKLKDVLGDDQRIQEFLKSAVKSADANILQHSADNPDTQGMGTTIVMAWLIGRRAYICWCGDSRCYVLSPRNGLSRLSKDHSYVQELIDRGELHPELALGHPMSNIITRCLGNSENRALPETRIYELHTGDVLMLCTDGLCGLCSDDDIAAIMGQHADNLIECKKELISAALAAGGDDNVTIGLCSVTIEGEEPEQAPEREEAKTDEVEQEAPKDLSSTVKSDAAKKGGGKKLFWILLLLLLAIAAACYFWLQQSGAPT